MENVLIITVTVLLFLQVGVIYLLLTRRSFKLKNVPEELEDFLQHLEDESKYSSKEAKIYLEKFIDDLQRHEENRDKTTASLNNFVKHLLSEITEVKNHINALQELTLEKDQIIRRYETGYDQGKIKQFRKELFKIMGYIKQEHLKEPNEALAEIYEDLELMLENTGIKRVEISVGDSFNDYIKVAKIVKIVETDDKEKDKSIYEIIKDGYIIEKDDSSLIMLQEAAVGIYKYAETEIKVTTEIDDKAINNIEKEGK